MTSSFIFILVVSQGSQHEIIDNLAQGAKNDPRQKSPVILGLIRN